MIYILVVPLTRPVMGIVSRIMGLGLEVGRGIDLPILIIDISNANTARGDVIEGLVVITSSIIKPGRSTINRIPSIVTISK